MLIFLKAVEWRTEQECVPSSVSLEDLCYLTIVLYLLPYRVMSYFPADIQTETDAQLSGIPLAYSLVLNLMFALDQR